MVKRTLYDVDSSVAEQKQGLSLKMKFQLVLVS